MLDFLFPADGFLAFEKRPPDRPLIRNGGVEPGKALTALGGYIGAAYLPRKAAWGWKMAQMQ